MQRVRQISCVVLALKKAGFSRCGVLLKKEDFRLTLRDISK